MSTKSRRWILPRSLRNRASTLNRNEFLKKYIPGLFVAAAPVAPTNAKYIGASTRAVRYLGTRTDAQLYLGAGTLFPA